MRADPFAVPPSGRPTGERHQGGTIMARIEGVDPEHVADGRIAATLAAQAERWGAPLLNHLLYARRPAIFHGARAMWAGLDASGLLAPAVVALVNRRVAALNGCLF